jgi:class 3 adenylate cyclase
MGDGVLVEFASAVNAVGCAVDLQEAMAAANRELPNDHHIVLRVGVNLGDIMVEGCDLHGDGVNIAARLEALAEPGFIVISKAKQASRSSRPDRGSIRRNQPGLSATARKGPRPFCYPA